MTATVVLQDRAVQLGAWCWVERRLFELVGGWVRSTDDAELKRCFAVHSRRHGFRAGLLAEQLPAAYVPPVDELIAPPAEAEVIERLGSLDGTPERAAALYRVVHLRLLVAYAICITTIVPATDGSLVRTLRILEGDLRRDWLEGETALQQLIVGTDDVDRLVPVVGELEKGLVKAHLSGNRRTAFGR